VFFVTAALLLALGAALFAFVLYTPAPAVPQLSGSVTKGALTVGGRRRTYLLYVPHGLHPNSPLVLVLHGSDGDAMRVRKATGYGFERVADKHGFAVAYPEAYDGNWNACNIRGGYTSNLLNIDDVSFLSALTDRLVKDHDVDRRRIFAAGISRGGSMAYRLALEVPSRFRAVAAVAANVPARPNFKCRPVHAATSVMIMNGTADPLNPFEGGEVGLLGMYRRGPVMSSHDSAEYFAHRAGITAPPHQNSEKTRSGVGVETWVWRNASVEVELVAIVGGGHGIPQPWSQHPRLLGPSPTEPTGPEMIWLFFSRQSAVDLGWAGGNAHSPPKARATDVTHGADNE